MIKNKHFYSVTMNYILLAICFHCYFFVCLTLCPMMMFHQSNPTFDSLIKTEAGSHMTVRSLLDFTSSSEMLDLLPVSWYFVFPNQSFKARRGDWGHIPEVSPFSGWELSRCFFFPPSWHSGVCCWGIPLSRCTVSCRCPRCFASYPVLGVQLF